MEKPLNEYIEHTNLSPTITANDVEKLIAEAKEYNFLGICVPPYWVRKARRDIGNLRLVTVVGFPLGYHRSEVKMKEIESAIYEGANEIDVVINVSAIKTQGWEWIKPEIAQFAEYCHKNEVLLKVILETAYLTDQEIVQACQICSDAGTDFVKTSTGFAPEGAKVEHIRLIRQSIPSHVGIKASGGIRTKAQALAMIEAGAERIGTSSGVKIMQMN
ncbi:MAG: deoxyribose-phosphate aldolase [Microscillaceae bacterium]|nr:deoxyribose-phosphate aldolase [Microscillaceae bacterium]MDW8461551.1 deoxyribose-phosphate aldolase [Cytophagales bacterium]